MEKYCFPLINYICNMEKKYNTTKIIIVGLLTIFFVYLFYIWLVGGIFHEGFYLPSFIVDAKVKKILKDDNPNKKYNIKYLETKFYDTGECESMFIDGCIRNKYNLFKFSYFYAVTDIDSDGKDFTVQYDTGELHSLKKLNDYDHDYEKSSFIITDKNTIPDIVFKKYNFEYSIDSKYGYEDVDSMMHLPITVYTTEEDIIDKVISDFKSKLKKEKEFMFNSVIYNSVDLYFVNDDRSRENDIFFLKECIYDSKNKFSNHERNTCEDIKQAYNQYFEPIFRYVIKYNSNNKIIEVEKEEYKFSTKNLK